MSDEASKVAADTKSTATNLIDHAKGAINAAMEAGSKTAENIFDQKLKETEHVNCSFESKQIRNFVCVR